MSASPASAKNAFQSNRRGERGELGDGHLVVLLVRIAPLHAGQRGRGKGGLDAQDGGGIRCGLRLAGSPASVKQLL